MSVVKLTIEYDGTAYVGWQVQPNGPSVQQAVEEALSRVVGGPVGIVSSGRTDAGVHAKGMVAHFSTERLLPMAAYREGVNRLLPADIAVVLAEPVADDFHARYSALAKRYRYSLCLSDVRAPLRTRYCWHYRRALDLDLMRQAADMLVGRHDFAAFRSAGCDAKTTVREVYAIRLHRHGELLHIDVVGSGFLRNMVRVIVGTLVEVGNGSRSVGTVAELLTSGKRTLSGVTAPPHGLCLMQVWYEGKPDDWSGSPKTCNSCKKSLDNRG